VAENGQRPYDVIILGATGFSGRLAAEYFSKRIDHDLAWAIAGRSEERLTAVRDQLGLEFRDIEILVLDVFDEDNLRDVVLKTKVILTAVGPYDELGEPLVRACAQLGTDYVDITGEPQFVNRMRERYQDDALQSGALIVHCCGFDSIPADVGAYLTAAYLPANIPKQVSCHVQTTGGMSGGTWASVLKALGGGLPRPSSRSSTPSKSKPWIQADPYSNRTLLKLPTIDPVIVRRSSRVFPSVYGSDFEYEHYLKLKDRGRAFALIFGVLALSILARIPPIRDYLQRLKPQGTGPTLAQRKVSRFRLRFFGRSRHMRVITEVKSSQDAYTDTGKMASECAILLATKRDQVHTQAGVSTPIGAFGHLLSIAMITAGLQVYAAEAQGRFRLKSSNSQPD